VRSTSSGCGTSGGSTGAKGGDRGAGRTGTGVAGTGDRGAGDRLPRVRILGGGGTGSAARTRGDGDTGQAVRVSMHLRDGVTGDTWPVLRHIGGSEAVHGLAVPGRRFRGSTAV